MKKIELIQALREATDLTKPEASAVVDIFFNGMADTRLKDNADYTVIETRRVPHNRNILADELIWTALIAMLTPESVQYLLPFKGLGQHQLKMGT